MGNKYADAIGDISVKLSLNEVLNEKSHKKVVDQIDDVKKMAEEPIKIHVDSSELDNLLQQEREIVQTIKEISHLRSNAKSISGLLSGNMSKTEIQKTIDALNSLYDIQNSIRRESGNTKRTGSDFLSGFSANEIKVNILPQLQRQLVELNKLGLENLDQLRERERLSSRLTKITKKDLDNAKARIVDGKDAEYEATALENIVETRRQVVEEMRTSGLFNAQEIEDIEKQNKGLVEQIKLLREIRVAKVKDGEKIVVQKDDALQPKAVGGKNQNSNHEMSTGDTNADAVARGNEMKSFIAHFEEMKNELGDTGKWFERWNELLNQIQQGALTASDALAKLREEMSTPKAQPAIQQEIKSQEELQKKIADANRVIKIQKQWLESLDPVLDAENFKTSGKREASEQLKNKTLHLLDVRRHPDQYDHLSDYSTKAELAHSQAYKEAERQGVAQSTLNRNHTDSIAFHDQNIAKLQKERDIHVKILEDAEKELDVLQQQLQTETKIEEIHSRKAIKTVNGKSGRFKIKLNTQETQSTTDDALPSSAEESAPKLNEEKGALDEVGDAAEKAAGKKKKFTKANKEVAASVGPSVGELKTEVDAIEKVGEAATKTNKIISDEARHSAESMNFSTRDYERLYDEMEAFAEQRKAENGYDLSRVSVNTDANGSPIGATISYYKKATKETITETFKIDKAAQEAEEGVNRLVLSSRKATAGIADFEKATLQAINRQDQLIVQKNKTLSSMSSVLDQNANKTLAGTDYEQDVKNKIKAIKDEVAKLDQVDSAGERVILSEKDYLAVKRRIAELVQDAHNFIEKSKRAEYGRDQFESHSVSSQVTYRKNNLKAKISEWERAGIYVGELRKKAKALLTTIDQITEPSQLKEYLEGVKEANALARVATQEKKAEKANQKALNAEYNDYMKLLKERNAIEKRMIGLDPETDKDKISALQDLYNKKDNQINDKYGTFLSRKDVQEYFNLNDFIDPQDEAELEMAFKRGAASDKKRLEENAAAQKEVNKAYQEYKRLIQERGSKQLELVGLDPEKNKEQINTVTAQIDEIDAKLNKTYGNLLSNKVAQATLTLEDFLKYYEKWQQKVADKEAKTADKARNREALPYLNYGKTTANSARRKLDATQGSVDALGVTNTLTLDKMDLYTKKVEKLEELRKKFAEDPSAAKDPALVKQFQQVAYEAENARRGIKAIIDDEQNIMQMSQEQGFSPVDLTADQINNLRNEMINFAYDSAQGRIEIKGWNDDNTNMYYTVTNAKGAVEEMTAALGQGTDRLYKYRTATKETGTLMAQILKGIKVKAKELVSFVIGGGSVYKVVEMLRQGIGYIREIDLALTELKKVTDETEETYDRFLETASKTAEKVGSTIKDVVSSTADWARLGYSMEQAAKFAETTQILMNVSEFTDVSQATDTLISAVQAFGYTAETSMDVVDLLNTIGEIIAYR